MRRLPPVGVPPHWNRARAGRKTPPPLPEDEETVASPDNPRGRQLPLLLDELCGVGVEEDAWHCHEDTAVPETDPVEVSGQAVMIDTDTIEVCNTRIRLYGIAAPESRQTCRAGGQCWPCGEQATRALADRIGTQPVTCEERDRDRYGRSVAVCRLAGQDLNAWLVAQGWAHGLSPVLRGVCGRGGNGGSGRAGDLARGLCGPVGVAARRAPGDAGVGEPTLRLVSERAWGDLGLGV